MTPHGRTWYLLRIALIAAALIIIFLSGIFPLEKLAALAPARSLTASVIPADVAALTNAARVQGGLAPLAVNPLLTEAAQMKADDMARGSYYAHVSPDGKSPLYWLNLVGYKYLNAGENLVIDRDTSADAVNAWMQSADHRENILRPQFTEIGVGVAAGEYQGIPTIFTVEEFGTPYPLSAPRTQTVVVTPKQVATAPLHAHATTSAPSTVPVVTPAKPSGLAERAGALVAPVAHALLPELPQPVQPGVLASSTAGQGTSTIAFALSPAFFAPVAEAPLHEAAESGAQAPPHPSLKGRITAYLQHIFSILRAPGSS